MNPVGSIKLLARKASWGLFVSVLPVKMEGQKHLVIKSIEWEEVLKDSPYSLEHSESINLSIQDAQLLIDDLWSAGLRPTDGTGSAGAMAATQKHLEDMRTLVFKKEEHK
jgi:hypothetical protein